MTFIGIESNVFVSCYNHRYRKQLSSNYDINCSLYLDLMKAFDVYNSSGPWYSYSEVFQQILNMFKNKEISDVTMIILSVQVCLRVDASQWSDPFTVDTIGDTGKIRSILVALSLSSLSYTHAFVFLCIFFISLARSVSTVLCPGL